MHGLLWHNLRSALRRISIIKSHTLISLLGLVIGLSSVFVIIAWTFQELTFDKFHQDYQSIYMVTTEIKGLEGDYNSFPETPPPLAETFQEQIPDIESATHFIYLYGGRSLTFGDDSFKEKGIATDEKFLEVFNFPLLVGNIKALEEPNAILLTEDLASKLFPLQEAMGKSLTYKDKDDLIVKGILKNIPKNSSLQFDFLVPYQIESDNPNEWWQLSDATFIKTNPQSDIQNIESTSQKLWRQHITDEQYNINFIPIQDLRYKSDFEFFEAEHGNFQKLYTFISVAVLIMVLACLNYINLNASYATKRTKEVMVRKVSGASTGSLIGYFISESVIISIISWVFAVLLSRSIIHLFQQVLGVEIDMQYLYLSFAAGLIITILVVGLISGLYPAIISSSVRPFHNGLISARNFLAQRRIKSALLFSQFVLSISLTIACLILIRQINFMSQFDVGYEKDNIIEIYFYNEKKESSNNPWKELNRFSGIEYISFAGASPVNLTPIFTTENWQWEGLSDGSHTSFYRINVDKDYLHVFEIPLVGGRFFSGASRDENSIVINQRLQKVLGFEDPIGKRIRRGEKEYEIIGVVKDFHFQHLSNEIQPLLFMYNDEKKRMFVRTNGEAHMALGIIRNHHQQTSNTPLIYHFLSESYIKMYAPEHKISTGIIVFTILTIILSCIGLFGMIVFTTEIKTKEIAIRKVHGAKISDITFILNKGILKWFAIAFGISSAVSLIVMNKWLENYAFRISIDWWIIISGALIILVITLLTVSFQTWKAAIKNPVDALKYE